MLRMLIFPFIDQEFLLPAGPAVTGHGASLTVKRIDAPCILTVRSSASEFDAASHIRHLRHNRRAITAHDGVRRRDERASQECRCRSHGIDLIERPLRLAYIRAVCSRVDIANGDGRARYGRDARQCQHQYR
ncbi:hypothetical protein [Paraburkholderia sp. J8-2]|uniref:hypothetical protein n=1 Tax=Paraburkholderia sp. J8-2 TaxID=2805440 RepID=UPI002AB6A66D|nr:hypothetical protein [Paraburkholderia sp. J8-2]